MIELLLNALQAVPSDITKSASTRTTDDRGRFLSTSPSGSYIKYDQNGSLALVADKSTSVFMSKPQSAVRINGKNIFLNGGEVRLNTKANGLIWNNKALNPALRDNEVLTKDGEYVKIFIDVPDFKFNQELIDMLRNFGIE